MSQKSRAASDIAAPGASDAFPVFAQGAGVYLCPPSWAGNFVTFFGSGLRVRFGPSTVTVSAAAVSAVASGVLTEDVQTGAPVEGRLDVRLPESAAWFASATEGDPRELYFAIDGDWTAYRSSNT